MAISTHDDEAAARALLAAAEADTSPIATRARIDLLGVKAGLASCLLLAPVYIGLAFWWLDKTRRSEAQTDGVYLFGQIFIGGCVLLTLALLTRTLTQPDKTMPDIISFAIRRAAAQGDDSLTPVTTIESAQATVNGGSAEIPVVFCPWLAKPAWWESPAAKLGSIALLQFYSLVFFLQALNIRSILFFWFIFAIAIFFVLNSLVASPLRERSEIRYLVADDAGLHGRHSATSRNLALLPWDQIASFTVRECQPSEGPHTTIYSVTANDIFITWRGVHSSARNEGALVDPAAGVRLAQYVAVHATVPPRDVTLAWDDICATVRWIEREDAGEPAEAASANVRAAVPGLGRVIREVVSKRHEPWRRIVRIASWIPLAFFLALYITDMFIRSQG
jgi:hypothetical protein